MDEKTRADLGFTISTLSLEYPNMCKTTLFQNCLRIIMISKTMCTLGSQDSLLRRNTNEKNDLCSWFFGSIPHGKNQILENLVIGDGKCVFHKTPESKFQSTAWQHTTLPGIVKAEKTISTCKVMVTVFRNKHGVDRKTPSHLYKSRYLQKYLWIDNIFYFNLVKWWFFSFKRSDKYKFNYNIKAILH